MKTLGLCMIVKNEEDTIGNCLESVKDIFDEIIIVDTGSIDRTKEILNKYNVTIYDFEWIDDFSAARNFSFSKATTDYIMWLDADDILKEEDYNKLVEIKKMLDGNIKQFAAKYAVSFDSNGNSTLEYNRERIFLRKEKYKWIGRIHEVIPMDSNIVYTDLCVTHNKIHPTETGRNLKIFQKMIDQKENLDARQEFYYGRELYFNGFYNEAIVIFKKCICNNELWLENKIQSHIDLSDCYKEICKIEDSLCILYSSFNLGLPRAEVCCKIGERLILLDKYNDAIYWYKRAFNSDININSGAFIDKDAYDYLPAIQLCYLYYKIGQMTESKKYNDLAGTIKPNDASFLYNVNYFNSINS